MKVFPLCENPEHVDVYIEYFQAKWATPDSMMVYDHCLRHEENRTDCRSRICWWIRMSSTGRKSSDAPD